MNNQKLNLSTYIINWLKRFNLFRRKALPLKAAVTVDIHFPDVTPITHVDTHYLSFSIDISVLAGGFWWEGSHKTHKGLGALRIPPLNLTSKKLDMLVKALGPAYLRVGGSEADKIYYFEAPESKNNEASLVLTKPMWDELNQFIQRNNLKFMFTFKYGIFKRSEHGFWQNNDVKMLLDYNRTEGYHIDVCELGNELNAYWAFHGLRSQPSAKTLAEDYSNFIHFIRENSPSTRISGPGSAFWPRLGETIKPFSNITEKFLALLEHNLDIVDWHYYPFQSRRSPIRTRTATIKNSLISKHLNDYGKYATQMRLFRDKHQPKAVLWTGETGSAQCGGEPKISDRFVSCFWWADQLGYGAVLGQKVMVRQSLIGGDYGLIDRLTLKPKPDYWICWLWGQLMGNDVYDIRGKIQANLNERGLDDSNSNNSDIRLYCHSAVRPTGKPIINGTKTLLIINISANRLTIQSEKELKILQKFEITAKKLTSKKIRINNIKPQFNKGTVSLKDFYSNKIDLQSTEIKPYSINFWCV